MPIELRLKIENHNF